jgi:hypothetical protein
VNGVTRADREAMIALSAQTATAVLTSWSLPEPTS